MVFLYGRVRGEIMKKFNRLIVLCVLVTGVIFIGNKNDSTNHNSFQQNVLSISIKKNGDDTGSLH